MIYRSFVCVNTLLFKLCWDMTAWWFSVEISMSEWNSFIPSDIVVSTYHMFGFSLCLQGTGFKLKLLYAMSLFTLANLLTLNSLKEITLYIAFLLCNISILKLSQEHRFLCHCIIDKTCEVICFIENISWYISPNNTLISFLSAYAMFVRWQTCFGLKMLDMLSGYCLKCCVL